VFATLKTSVNSNICRYLNIFKVLHLEQK